MKMKFLIGLMFAVLISCVDSVSSVDAGGAKEQQPADSYVQWTQLETSGVYYTKIDGIVYLRGTATPDGILGYLPVGYRPFNTMSIPTVGADWSDAVIVIQASTGEVGKAGSINVVFDFLSFPAEQ